jgi:hypothetical protein
MVIEEHNNEFHLVLEADSYTSALSRLRLAQAAIRDRWGTTEPIVIWDDELGEFIDESLYISKLEAEGRRKDARIAELEAVEEISIPRDHMSAGHEREERDVTTT